MLAVPRHGALNVHPSLLPRHRGASPIPATILAGDAWTGVTLIRMDEGLDTGPIVGQEKVLVPPDAETPGLASLLASWVPTSSRARWGTGWTRRSLHGRSRPKAPR